MTGSAWNRCWRQYQNNAAVASQTGKSVSEGNKFAALAGVLACPDDRQTLRFQPGSFHCDTCVRRFEIIDEALIDLRPQRFWGGDCGSAEFAADYLREFQREFRLDPNALAWGAPETTSTVWRQKRERQVRRVLPLIVNGGPATLLCDFSGGAGYYTLAYASQFHLVLHCDLSVDALNYAMKWAVQRRLSNVIFLRIDYFFPPFRRSLDRVICLDTLIRGAPHELVLLRSILEALAPGGVALIDFHNWWHNPLRRLGLLPQNFGDNQSYTRAQAESVLQRAGCARWEYFAFHQESTPLLPPTRHMYRISAGAS